MAGEPFVAIAPLYDRIMSRVPYDEWADYVTYLARHWNGTTDRVLDLACGTGSVGLELAQRGSRVVGVDLAAGMLRAGRVKAAEAGLRMHFVRQDMRALGLRAEFDLVVCLFDSLNYVLELEGLQAAFHGVRAALAPGGLFIFDLNTLVAFELELFTQEDMAPEAPVKLRWKSHYDRETRIAEVAMDFYLDDGRVVRETHHERGYSAAELRGALADAGLETLAVYEAFTFRVPRPRTDRVYYVCRAKA